MWLIIIIIIISKFIKRHVCLQKAAEALKGLSCCGSSSSIRIPSLKFVGLAIRKIWRMMCVSINGSGVLDLWPFDLETGTRVAYKMGTFLPNLGTIGLWVLELFGMYATDRQRDRRTDGRMNGQKQRLSPLHYGRWHNKALCTFVRSSLEYSLGRTSTRT